MWLRSIEKNSITDIIKTKEVGTYGNIKVLNNNAMGDILVKNDDIYVCENNFITYNEMFIQVPLCSHPEPKNVLLIGYNNGAIEQILKHKDVQNITIIDENEDKKNALTKYFDKYNKYAQNDKVTLVQKDITSLSEKDKENIDIILIDDVIYNKDIFDTLAKVLKSDGLFVVKSISYTQDIEKQKKQMTAMSDAFKIIMPYNFDMPLYIGSKASFIFASNKFHPTADIILHKSDLLEDITYYSGDIHKSSFILPTNINKEYKNIAKN